jgi:hypothetical protein
MNIELAEALWILEMLSQDELPDIAIELLDDGLYSPDLQKLSELSPDSSNEISDAFERSLLSLGRGRLTKTNAVQIYARAIAAEILNGEITPYSGARKIWDATLKIADPTVPDLDPFIYAASEHEERPNDREFFNQEILKCARELLSHS